MLRADSRRHRRKRGRMISGSYSDFKRAKVRWHTGVALAPNRSHNATKQRHAVPALERGGGGRAAAAAAAGREWVRMGGLDSDKKYHAAIGGVGWLGDTG